VVLIRVFKYENLYNKGEIPLQYGLNVKRYAMKKLKNFVLITLTCSMQLAFSAGYTDNALWCSNLDMAA
jgi:hypothetical protein